ncbi:hypothetical protein LguiA_027635 [Lonicera macranthoides]
MGSKKKRKRGERPTIHPRNKYAGIPPDFSLLASLYPSFKPYVFYSTDGRPKIDWTDFDATRELTRVLLLHDHHLNWWIPDGQLCPTVPNRSNYIHWIEDLLSSDIIPNALSSGDIVKGFDIGTGANCIYPLLGATLLGWSFVGSDVTDVALEWADRNVKNNPHISRLIEIRKVDGEVNTLDWGESHIDRSVDGENCINPSEIGPVGLDPAISSSLELNFGGNQSYQGPPILLGVVKDGEYFDFCMCNPPFFETMEEAGLNPNTACGGTPMEMVCPGGEQAFISRIIEDSAQLKRSFRWYTSMVGRKSNLKILTSKLWEVGVSVVKTTEFVQGQTCRWGLAWSFVPPAKKIISSRVGEKRDLSFMLEGIQRQYGAFHVLQSVESFFSSSGASSKSNVASFYVDVNASQYNSDAILKNEMENIKQAASHQYEGDKSSGSNSLNFPSSELSFRISVFQQIAGTLLVRGSLQQKETPLGGSPHILILV